MDCAGLGPRAGRRVQGQRVAGGTAGAIRAPVDRSCLISPSETPLSPRKSSQPRRGRRATIASAVVRFTPGSLSISPAVAELRSTQCRAGGGSGCLLGGLYFPWRIEHPSPDSTQSWSPVAGGRRWLMRSAEVSENGTRFLVNFLMFVLWRGPQYAGRRKTVTNVMKFDERVGFGLVGIRHLIGPRAAHGFALRWGA